MSDFEYIFIGWLKIGLGVSFNLIEVTNMAEMSNIEFEEAQVRIRRASDLDNERNDVLPSIGIKLELRLAFVGLFYGL